LRNEVKPRSKIIASLPLERTQGRCGMTIVRGWTPKDSYPTEMTIFPRAWRVPRYRIASGASRNG
jgi:hypothetical protein